MNHYSPALSLYSGNEPEYREVCVPAPRDWGDPNCDGTLDAGDVIAFLRHAISGSSECTSLFQLDITGDNQLDRADLVMWSMCRSSIMWLPDLFEACDRINIELEEATTDEGVTVDDTSGESVTVSWDPDPNATSYTIEVTVNGEPTACTGGCASPSAATPSSSSPSACASKSNARCLSGQRAHPRRSFP